MFVPELRGDFLELSVNFAAELNPHQWEAVNTTDGPLLILAGAGSGKTRALTYRIAYLVASGKAKASEIFAVTFTNKAAKEMLERSVSLLGRVGVPLYGRDPVWISTFHSSCARILRQHIHLIDGYDGNFVIYDDSEQLAVLKKVCAALDLNDKMYPPKTFQHQINKAKNEFISPDNYQKERATQFLSDKITKVYGLYERMMRQHNALDFGDLLYKTTELFRDNPDLLDQYQERFKYIMVDEYQDTNHVQYVLIKMLSTKYKNICVVGDEDQSIYSWRGADISNILNFEKDFPEAKIVKLEENYRSTKNIVEAASHVIKRNSERKDKTLWTSNEAGHPIQVREEYNEFEEARGVAREIATLASEDNLTHNDFAIFYRTNAQSRVLEDQLRSQAIPYKIIGGIKFYDRAEVKDLLSYLKICLNPKDNVGLKRIINSPGRGIGKTTVEKLEAYSDSKEISLFEGLVPAIQDKILDRGASSKVLAFVEVIQGLRQKASELSPSEMYHAALDATQYVQKLKLENTPESLARIENLEELDSAIGEFERERGDDATLAAFLEEVALVTESDRNLQEVANNVTLMTLHISKGLEFPVVFIVGLEDGLFPSIRDDDFGQNESEEERRLFYVGMTRARQRLYLSHARSRKVWGNEQSNPPSRFLAEIPERFINKTSRMKTPQWQQRSTLFGSDFNSDTQSVMPNYDVDISGGWNPSSYDASSDTDGDGLRKGMRVRHPSFGVGTVHQLEGQGPDQKVTILFPNNSMKKFVVKFARLEKV